MVENMGSLLICLLKILSEVQVEEVAETLENIVGTFPDEIVPFAVQLVEHLSQSVVNSSGAGDARERKGKTREMFQVYTQRKNRLDNITLECILVEQMMSSLQQTIQCGEAVLELGRCCV